MSLASTTPSPGVMLPSATAAVIAPIAPAISAARVPHPLFPRFYHVEIRHRQLASTSRSSITPAAFVARFVDPRGRPAGLPDRPFSTGRPRTRLLFFAVFCSDNSGMDISFRRRSPLIEKKGNTYTGFSTEIPLGGALVLPLTPYAFITLYLL
jgi:hypothetical protein